MSRGLARLRATFCQPQLLLPLNLLQSWLCLLKQVSRFATPLMRQRVCPICCTTAAILARTRLPAPALLHMLRPALGQSSCRRNLPAVCGPKLPIRVVSSLQGSPAFQLLKLVLAMLLLPLPLPLLLLLLLASSIPPTAAGQLHAAGRGGAI